jgi:hypothetical protein
VEYDRLFTIFNNPQWCCRQRELCPPRSTRKVGELTQTGAGSPGKPTSKLTGSRLKLKEGGSTHEHRGRLHIYRQVDW